jgi:hypothetical protein
VAVKAWRRYRAQEFEKICRDCVLVEFFTFSKVISEFSLWLIPSDPFYTDHEAGFAAIPARPERPADPVGCET